MLNNILILFLLVIMFPIKLSKHLTTFACINNGKRIKRINLKLQIFFLLLLFQKELFM